MTTAKRQTRTIEIRAAPGENENYLVEGYAAIFDATYVLWRDAETTYSERIARGALDGVDMTDVIMRYDHTGNVLARTSNGSLALTQDDHGLKIRADLSKSTAARELYEEIAAGLVTQMSWAFTIRESAYDRVTHTDTITRIDHIYDVSAVSIPANDQTSITTARSRARTLEGADTLERRRRATLLELDIALEVDGTCS